LEHLLPFLVYWKQILALSDSFEPFLPLLLLVIDASAFSADRSFEEFLVYGLSEGALSLQIDRLQNLEDG